MRFYIHLSTMKQARRIEIHQSKLTGITCWTCGYLHKVTLLIDWLVFNKKEKNWQGVPENKGLSCWKWKADIFCEESY